MVLTRVVGWAGRKYNHLKLRMQALHSILDFHTKFHQNWTEIGKVSGLSGWGGWIEKKSKLDYGTLLRGGRGGLPPLTPTNHGFDFRVRLD